MGLLHSYTAMRPVWTFVRRSRERLQALVGGSAGLSLAVRPVIDAMGRAEREMLDADPDLPLRRVSPRPGQADPALARLEQQARRVEELEAELRRREEQLAIMVHDLRVPLAPLVMVLGRLREDLRTADETIHAPYVRARVDVIGGRLSSFKDRLDSVLDATRMQTTRLALEPEPVDLLVLVRGVVEEVRAGHDRAPEPRFTGEATLVGAWDRRRMEQIVRNLITNAYRFGGHEPVVIAVERTEAAAILTITDRGAGIRDADLARIFEKHVRLQSGPGFGLGLWIVKQLLDAMGGSITVTSAPGRGAEFRAVLPV